ncbi:hypothetical protein [Rhodococcus sp. IEGM 1374]|uniref:hypothetical protein n=1 Tax=Rhodococcus sp. IEGM 1374 TaxID=3082221 RepID=UPI00295443BD|nr:hypothetical protein [Rhodococcus sp. IEGM 1374]MDV7991597.1 hypothetical protein [Rhodococcus sp. IEGM 1374]
MSVTPVLALDRETVLARARDAALARTKFVEALIDAAQAAAQARDQVAAATRVADRADAEHADAYNDALAAGWTVAELKASGLNAPTASSKKKPARRNTAAKSARSTAPRRPGEVDTPASDAAAVGHTDSPPPNVQ